MNGFLEVALSICSKPGTILFDEVSAFGFDLPGSGIKLILLRLMDYIIQFDIHLFHLINQVWTTPLLDQIMSFMRNQFVWGPLYVFMIVYLIFNFGTKGLVYCLFLIGLIALSDQVSSQLIKKNVRRLRPCNQVELQDQRRLLVRCGSGYSFTSSHAANHFTFAVFVVMAALNFIGRARYLFLLWAACIGYAQVYVGVHFPMDVFFGSLVGCLAGFMGAKIYNTVLYKA